MRIKKSFGIFLIIGMGILLNCTKQPEFSNVPSISFSSVKYIPHSKSVDADSLILRINFQDGDGDLGLDGTDSKYQSGDYAEKKYYLYFSDNTVATLDGNPYSLPTWSARNAYPQYVAVQYNGKFWGSLINSNTSTPGLSNNWIQFYALNYAAYRTNTNLKTSDGKLLSLNPFVTPYNCSEWEVYKPSTTSTQKTDTLAVRFNPNYYNIFVDILTKNPDGSFTAFDPLKYYLYDNCVVNVYNSRFPVLSSSGSNENSLRGVIQYSMLSRATQILFSNRVLKLRIQIQDRAFNKSNVVETPEFTLQSIQ